MNLQNTHQSSGWCVKCGLPSCKPSGLECNARTQRNYRAVALLGGAPPNSDKGQVGLVIIIPVTGNYW